jgi:hypothetical protein
MQAKINEIANLTATNGKLQKQIEELRLMLMKQRKQEQMDQSE